MYNILDFMDIRTLDGAQRVNILERFASLPTAGAVPGLLAAVESALALEWSLMGKRRVALRASSGALHAPEAPALDKRADDLLAVFHGRLELSVRLAPPPKREGVLASLLLTEGFPTGLGAITQQPFHVECASIGEMLFLFDSRPELSAAIDALGHRALIQELAELHVEYGASLHQVSEASSGEDLAADDKIALGKLASIIARICGRYPDDTEADLAAREVLLGHFVRVEQDDRERKRRASKAEAPKAEAKAETPPAEAPASEPSASEPSAGACTEEMGATG